MENTKVLHIIQELSYYYAEANGKIALDKVISQCDFEQNMTTAILEKLEQMKLVTISNNVVELTAKGKTAITEL